LTTLLFLPAVLFPLIPYVVLSSPFVAAVLSSLVLSVVLSSLFLGYTSVSFYRSFLLSSPFFFAFLPPLLNRGKNGENAFLLRVASVAKRKCNL